MLKLSIEIHGSARQQLRSLSQKLNNLTPLMSKIGQLAVEQLDKTYAAESDPYGKAWAPLAASTLQQKTGSAILIERGSLNSSVGYQASGDEAQVSYSDKKAKWHHNGTSRMPARPLVPENGIPSEWEPAIESLIEGYLGGPS